MAGPPLGAPTDFGKRGILPQKEAGPPLEASLPGVAGPLGMGEVGVCRGLKCWLHYLHCIACHITPADSENRKEKEGEGKGRKGKERKGKATAFGVNSIRSQVLYRAAQGPADSDITIPKGQADMLKLLHKLSNSIDNAHCMQCM